MPDPSLYGNLIGLGLIGSILTFGYQSIQEFNRPKDHFLYIPYDPEMETLMNNFTMYKDCDPKLYEEIVNVVETAVRLYIASLSPDGEVTVNDITEMNNLILSLQSKISRFYSAIIRKPEHLTDYESDTTQIIAKCENYIHDMNLELRDQLQRT